MAHCMCHITQELALYLYALARLGYRPSPVWLNSFVASSFDKLDTFTPRELSNMMWAAAQMDWMPPFKFWQALCMCAQEAFTVCNAQDMANILHAGVCRDG